MRNVSKILWLFLVVVVSVVLSPGYTAAQEEKGGLSFRLSLGSYYSEVKPGRDNIFFLEVENTGKEAITNIRLDSDKPEGWIIEFTPNVIAYLSPGSLQTVDANIKPASNASKGEYRITFIAEANNLRRVISTMVRVETTTSLWLWIGIIMAAVVVAGFVYVFIRFGRQ